MEDMFIMSCAQGRDDITYRANEQVMPLVVAGLKAEGASVRITAWHRSQEPLVDIIVDAFTNDWREV